MGKEPKVNSERQTAQPLGPDPVLGELDAIATKYDPSNASTHFDYWLKRLQVNALTPWIRGQRMLELGCATGELASLMDPLVDAYDVVEGSARNIEVARSRVPGARFFQSLWEAFEPDCSYSDILLSGTLEHANDPVTLLGRARSWLEPGGRVHVVVPNGMSLHRLVGAELGLQPDPLTLTAADRAQGHHRNYTIDMLMAQLSSVGLRVRHWQGVFLKVLPNREMLGWSWDLIQALHAVGQRFPAHCAELLAVAEKIENSTEFPRSG
jgi:trans-aconitate methyltransferase